MRQTVSALLCILVIITGTNALGPQLSPSFSFQGTAVSTATAGSIMATTTYTRYDVAIDATRGLLASTQVATLESGGSSIPFTRFTIESVNDSMQYVVLNGVCNSFTYTVNPTNPMSYSPNFWSKFDNAVENPPGTYTVTFPPFVQTLVTENGLPTSYSYVITGATSFEVTSTRFTNSTPPFSAFALPAACSQFNCTACYSSAVNLGSSFILMLLALVALAVMYSTV